MKKLYCYIATLTLSMSPFLFGDVRLPSIIGDHMALQQNAAVAIWGWAEPGEKIQLQPDWNTNQKKRDLSAIADGNGRWRCALNTPKAGGPYALSIKGNNTIELKNIVIGEVWLCSGQSNMGLPMVGAGEKTPIHGGADAIAESANKSIRLFRVGRAVANQPLEDVEGEWVECGPETVGSFSAVGYFFGKAINSSTGYPVGLICSAYGGTAAQAWTRIGCMETDDRLRPIIETFDRKRNDWEQRCREAEKQDKSKPPVPVGARSVDQPAVLYNAMIAPLVQMTIKGTIWYQGESNAETAYLYRDLFPAMIQNWRCDFNHFEMPFYFVQLANLTAHKPGGKVTLYQGDPRGSHWAELREAQLMTSSLKNTGMAVTIDIGDSNNIHPGNKKDVGERLARWALAKEYGKDIPYSGPLYQGHRIEGDKIRIIFSHVESGLLSKGGKVRGVAIAGKDQKFVWADAEIDGGTLLVFKDGIKNPVAVRYAWDMGPENNMYNGDGLPASPFRTDDWNGVTYGLQ